jgi:hypothetical protein
MATPVMYEWDVDEIFKRAGGPQRLVDMLARANFHLPVLSTVYAWKARASIPADWLAPIVYVLLRDGVGIHEMMKIRAEPPRPAPLED